MIIDGWRLKTTFERPPSLLFKPAARVHNSTIFILEET